MSVAVIGLGNVLLGDDGFGPFVVELLRTRYAFPPEVALLDLGTPGLGLTSYLCGHEAVVLVDAVAAAGQPGDIRLYEGAELERLPIAPRVSPHDPAVFEALAVARLAGEAPREVCLVGAAPGGREPGAGLSPRMRGAAEAAVEIVRRQVEDWGFPAQCHDGAAVEHEWWLRAGADTPDPSLTDCGRGRLTGRGNTGSNAA
jgi:hydrogenase maturation protease